MLFETFWFLFSFLNLCRTSYRGARAPKKYASLKEEEYHFILPSQYKYDFLDGYPRGSTGINMFSISKMSEIDPRGGFSNFQKCLKFKNV